MAKWRTKTPNEQAMLALLQSLSRHLCLIKQIEMQWLTVFSALTVPAIGYFAVSNMYSDRNARPYLCLGMTFCALAYLMLTIFFQYTLCNERKSYFKVMLVLELIQHHFRLDRTVFPISMAYSARVKGYGPTSKIKKDDSTQPWATFMIRMAYTWGILTAILLAALWQIYRASLAAEGPLDWRDVRSFAKLAICVWAADFIFLTIFFIRDNGNQKKNCETAKTEKLVGSDML